MAYLKQRSLFNMGLCLPISIVALVGAILYCIQVWGDIVKNQTVFYYARQTTFLLTVLIIPLSIVLTLIQIHRLERKSTAKRSVFPLGIGILILISANGIACSAIVPLIFHQQENIDTVYLDNYVYRLDALSSPEVGGGIESVLVLRQCDATGWFCRIIDGKDFYRDMTPSLTVDVQHKMLFFRINGNLVASYTSSG